MAGPICVGAVVMCSALEGIVDDSKKLTAAQRQVIAQLIKEQTVVGLGWASPAFIDQNGLTAALRMAAIRAITQISENAETILLDGNNNYIGYPQVRTIVGGDGIDPAIAAASIIAKVARDSYMQTLGLSRYKGYGFEAHVGYGTEMHRSALVELGPCDIHRMSFGMLRGQANVD